VGVGAPLLDGLYRKAAVLRELIPRHGDAVYLPPTEADAFKLSLHLPGAIAIEEVAASEPL